MPLLRAQPGFQGFLAFHGAGDPGHAVSVGLWSGRGAAMAAHQRVAEVEALRDAFPAPPRITAGTARVVAAAAPSSPATAAERA